MKNIFKNVSEIKNILPKDKKVTLVGGCFDLIHVGHVHLFKYAASIGEILVVAVLSDNYARKYKEVGRPVISQKQRAEMVASIRFVDFVYVTDVSPSSSETLGLLKPSNVVFDAEEPDRERMKKRIENIKKYSPYTKVYTLRRYREDGISTTSILDKIRRSLSSL